MSSSAAQPANLSPAQANFVYWFSGLAPVATNIVTPLVVFWTMRNKPGVTNLQRYNQQVNEVVRQFVSGTIGLVSFFGGGELTRGLLKALVGKERHGRKELDESTKHVAMIVGGVIMSFIGFAFVRPKISTDLICSLLKKSDSNSRLISLDKIKKTLAQLAATNASPLTESQIETAFAGFQKKQYLTVGQIQEKMATLVQDAAVQKDALHPNNALVQWLEDFSAKKAPPSGWLAKLRDQAESYIIPNGEPDVKRTTALATVLLTGYLSALTAVMWGLNRSLSRLFTKQQPTQLPTPAWPPFQSPYPVYHTPPSPEALKGKHGNYTQVPSVAAPPRMSGIYVRPNLVLTRF